MSTVVMHNVVSLDGFVADPHDDPGPLFEWYFNGDRRLDAQDMDDPAACGCPRRRTTTSDPCGTPSAAW